MVISGTVVVCEVKQLEPTPDDLAELREIANHHATGRFLPNRVRQKLTKVSRQLRASADAGRPTLLVLYDNTPVKSYTMHADIVCAMFGENCVLVREGPEGDLRVSPPFFGGKRRMTPTTNTSIRESRF